MGYGSRPASVLSQEARSSASRSGSAFARSACSRRSSARLNNWSVPLLPRLLGGPRAPCGRRGTRGMGGAGPVGPGCAGGRTRSRRGEEEMRTCARAGFRGGGPAGCSGRRRSGAATESARDTSQIDVAALHERDRTVTGGLHGEGACQRGMGLSTVVSDCGQPAPRASGSAPKTSGADVVAVRAGRPGRTERGRREPAERLARAFAGVRRCEARHETSVRPRPAHGVGPAHRGPRPGRFRCGGAYLPDRPVTARHPGHRRPGGLPRRRAPSAHDHPQ